MNNLLFIYGTLLDSNNEFAQYLQEKATYYTEAKFEGELYDAGNYPAAIVKKDCCQYVYGSIVTMNDPVLVFITIDPYEGYGKGNPRPYLYLRKLISADTAMGKLKCWVYLYNRPVDGFRLIPSGNYREYLKNKKSS